MNKAIAVASILGLLWVVYVGRSANTVIYGSANSQYQPGHTFPLGPNTPQQSEVCSGNKIPEGYVIIGDKPAGDCPTGYRITIKKAGDRETACFYSPIPASHVVVGNKSRKQGCQNNPGMEPNTIDIKLPGQREIICYIRAAGSQPILVPPGYVVVGKANSDSCITSAQYNYNAQEIRKIQ